MKEERQPVKITYSSSVDQRLKKILIQALEYATGRSMLERKLNRVLDTRPNSNTLWRRMLEELNINVSIDHVKLKAIPTNGPLILIANHPFGVVDGIVMANIASQIRPHFKALVNEVLCKDESINSCFLPVDFRDTKEAREINIASRNAAMNYLKTGGTIVIFPAGGVSTSPKMFKKAEDLEWKRFVVKLIDRTDATIVPIYFEGQNSQAFQLASLINLNLRYGLLLHEVKNKMGRTINVAVGKPIDARARAGLTRNQVLGFLRNRVYELAS